MKRLQLLAFAAIALSSSCTVTEPYETKSADQYCNDLNALIGAYDNHFDSLKGSKSDTKRMDIWKAKRHLVGDDCEIWGWGYGKADYICSHSFPTEAIARETYVNVQASVKQCLGDNWAMHERPRELGNGDKTWFQQDKALPIVSVHIVETAGVFSSAWSAYIFVGDPSDSL